jgi:hypothetical protein
MFKSYKFTSKYRAHGQAGGNRWMVKVDVNGQNDPLKLYCCPLNQVLATESNEWEYVVQLPKGDVAGIINKAVLEKANQFAEKAKLYVDYTGEVDQSLTFLSSAEFVANVGSYTIEIDK